MKPILLALLLCSFLSPLALADGYPFDPESQRVSVPSLRLKLSIEQIQQVSSMGGLTFSKDQLLLIRHFYPAATERTGVIAATFNDNNEELSDTDVYCFWVAPDEVAITLNEKHPKGKSPFEAPSNNATPKEDEIQADWSNIRISPDGGIFYRGKPISLQDVFAMIDEMAHPHKPEPNQQIVGNSQSLRVVIPPPYAGYDLHSAESDDRPDPKKIFDALTIYGASKGIGIHRTW